MIQKIKAFLGAYKENERLKGENKKLNQEIGDFKKHSQQKCTRLETENAALRVESLEKSIPLPAPKPKIKDLMKLVFNGKLEWYDWKELDAPGKINYYNQAQHILRADIFNNEINFLKSNWSKQAVIEAHAVEDPEEHMLKLSWMLLAIELFKERLKEIPNPVQKTPTKIDTKKGI